MAMKIRVVALNSSFLFIYNFGTRRNGLCSLSGSVTLCSSGLCYGLKYYHAVLGKVFILSFYVWHVFYFSALWLSDDTQTLRGSRWFRQERKIPRNLSGAVHRGLHVVSPSVRWNNGLFIPKAPLPYLHTLRVTVLF